MLMALRTEASIWWMRKTALPHIPQGIWDMALRISPL
jgi:hypothetical protein